MKSYNKPQFQNLSLEMESAILSGSEAGNIHRYEGTSEALSHKSEFVVVSEEW